MRDRAEFNIPSIGLPLAFVTPALLVVGLLGPTGVAGAQGTLTPFARAKATRLLREQLPCLGCHALGAEGGRLAPDLATVAQRRSADYIAAMVDDPQGRRPGSAMPRPRLPAATRDLVVRFLQGGARPTGGDAAPAFPPGPGATTGAQLYARWCAGCHGSAGKGDGPNAAHLPVKPSDHTSADLMARRSDDALHDTIAGGGLIMNRSPRMPAFGGTLSDAELRALVAHLRTLCGCQGPRWSRGP